MPTLYAPAGHGHAPILPPAFFNAPTVIAPDLWLPRPGKSRLSIFGSSLPLDKSGWLNGAKVLAMLHDLHEIASRPGIDPPSAEREHVFDHGENIVRALRRRCQLMTALVLPLTHDRHPAGSPLARHAANLHRGRGHRRVSGLRLRVAAGGAVGVFSWRTSCIRFGFAGLRLCASVSTCAAPALTPT